VTLTSFEIDYIHRTARGAESFTIRWWAIASQRQRNQTNLTPAIKVNPGKSFSDALVKVNGSNFAGATIRFSYNSRLITSSIPVDLIGNFTAEFRVPADSPTGKVKIDAKDDEIGFDASANFFCQTRI